VATKVTIAELLQHTGGTGDIFGPEFEAHRLELRDLEDYVKLFGARGPEFEPGTRREYSNYGFILLGVLVQRVSGQSYYDYVRDHIFVPARMTGSGSEPESVAVAGRAVGYTQGPDGSWSPVTDLLPFRGTSAGGGYTTVGDLLRFATALKNHTLLDARGLDLFSRGDPTAPEGNRFPLGSGRHVWDGAAYFGHNGGFPGMNGDLEIGLDSGYAFVVLGNIDPPAAERISEFIGSRLPSK
jgi:CubicO group peptidase (beta-lactamase class C family)